MKKLLLLSLLIPSIALSQGWQIPNPAGTPRALPTPGTSMSKANVDIYGNQQVVTVGSGGSGLSQSVVPVSRQSALNGVPIPQIKGTYNRASDTVEAASTTTVLNLASHSARVGDVIKFRNGTNAGAEVPVCSVTTNTVTLCAALVADPSTADIWINSPQSIASFMAGGDSTPANGASLAVAIDSGYQNAAATGILKLEDAAHATGDAGVMSLGVRNESYVALADGNLDYSPLGLYRSGALMTNLDLSASGASGVGIPYMFEDTAIAASQAIMISGGQSLSTVAQSVGASGDAAPIALDLGNRQITTMAPAGETGTSCSSEATGTADTTLLGAIASNRWYITSINCSNNSAVASRISFKEGAVVKAIGGVGTLAATGGGMSLTFNPPIRGSVNTNFIFSMTTTLTATTCCATGYYSTI